MMFAPLAAETIRRRMDQSLGLQEPVTPGRTRTRRVAVRSTSATALRRLADRLEPAAGPA